MHRRAAHPGLGPPMVGPGSCGKEGGQCSRQTSRGRQHRPAPPPGPDTRDSLEESTGRHPLFRSPAAPPPPRDRGAPLKLRVPLCPRARAPHPHPLPLSHTAGPGRARAFLNPEISHGSPTRRPLTCSQHPDPRPGFPRACKHGARAARPPANRCPAPGAPPNPVPWGSVLQVPSTPPSSSWLPRRTAAR